MLKFYEKLIGGFEIEKNKEKWRAYQLGAIKAPFGFNGLIVLIILLVVFSFLLPDFQYYLDRLILAIVVYLFLKFGEYRGYNESLHDLENE